MSFKNLVSHFLLLNFSLIFVHGVYEHNPFFNSGNSINDTTDLDERDINQVNIALVLPAGAHLPPQGEQTPAPPAPGYVWLQVPISHVPGEKPVTDQNQKSSSVSPAVTQNPPTGNYGSGTEIPPRPTTEPIFTIEPPWILQGDLSKKCLRPRGQFPSNTCKTYVNCWDGVATEETCPGNFLFNPKGLYCDFPENVKCNEKQLVTEEKTIPTTVPNLIAVLSSSVPPTEVLSYVVDSSSLTSTKESNDDIISQGPTLRSLCLKPRGQFPSYSCSKYINCWDDNVVEQDCPEGLLFSARGYCDFAPNVDCKGRSTQTSATPAKDQIIEISPCPIESGTFRDKNNCSQYFTCLNNQVAAKYECPVGFSFSDILGVCDYSYRVDCSKEPLIFQTKNATSQIQNTKTEPQVNYSDETLSCPVDYGIYRDKINCRKYYICVSKKVVAQHECPIGYNFNDNIGSCDFADKVKCQEAPKIFQITSNSYVPPVSTDMMQKVEKCKPGTVFRLNPQCSSACKCTNGLVEIIKCSDGLAYDSSLDKCVPLNQAKC